MRRTVVALLWMMYDRDPARNVPTFLCVALSLFFLSGDDSACGLYVIGIIWHVPWLREFLLICDYRQYIAQLIYLGGMSIYLLAPDDLIWAYVICVGYSCVICPLVRHVYGFETVIYSFRVLTCCIQRGRGE